MKFRLLPLPFYSGLPILLLGILFRTMHWPGGTYMIFGGMLFEITFTIMILLEILTSIKARRKTKLFWGASYVLVTSVAILLLYELRIICFLLIFISGLTYLGFGRKKFIVPDNDLTRIKFDSITID